MTEEKYQELREIEARYLESRFDFTTVEGIDRIPVSIDEPHPEFICGVTGCIEYYLLSKGSEYEKKRQVDLALACYRKAVLIMPLRGVGYYKIDSYRRLPNYLRKLKRFDEAREADDYIRSVLKLDEPHEVCWTQNGRTITIRCDSELSKEALQRQIDRAFSDCDGLVAVSSLGAICAKCASYRNRVYSLDGKNTHFPKFPPDFHLDCGLMPFPYYEGITSSFDEFDNSRPYSDDRTPEEKQSYDQWKAEMDRRKQAEYCREDYNWLMEFCPDCCPKSFSAYMRARSAQTAAFKEIQNAALQLGKSLE